MTKRNTFCSIIVLSILTSLFSFPLNAHEKTSRPKVAVVLGGGGAKGLAEIPLLAALDEEGIPIDLITGTSMGSIIGALYATGHTPLEIVHIACDTDIMALLNARGEHTEPLPAVPFSYHRDNILALDFKKDDLGSAPALLGDQKINNFLAGHFNRIPGPIDFDTLPVRFRAVATDLLNGSKIVFDRGSLTDSLRSSMSIPGAWTPAIIDKNTYTMDGGIVDNLPVNLARELGADIVIAIDVSSDIESNPAAIDSVSDLAMHIFTFFTAINSVPQYNSADVLLLPELKDYPAYDFPHAREIVQAGQKCVDQNREKIHSLALALAEKGCKLEPRDYHRKSIYSSLPFLTVQGVVIHDVSNREPCPLPSPRDFSFLTGKQLDNATTEKLVGKLEQLAVEYNLASLWYNVLSGTESDKCIIEICANHYNQKMSKAFIGGYPGIQVTLDKGNADVSISPNFSTGIHLVRPFSMSALFSYKECAQGKLEFTPVLLNMNKMEFCLDAALEGILGRLEVKTSRYFKDRLVDEDIGLDANIGLQLRYLNKFTCRAGFDYDFCYLNSNESYLNYMGIYAGAVFDSLQSDFSFSGIKLELEGEFCSPLTEWTPYFNARVSYMQNFELIKKRNSLGIMARASLMHYPYRLFNAYADYGGFEGMCGYGYGSFRRDSAVTGISYMHKLFEIAGIPLTLVAQARAGLHDAYEPFTASEEPTQGYFFADTASFADAFDFGGALYIALGTPIGNIVFGAGGNNRNKWSLLLGLR